MDEEHEQLGQAIDSADTAEPIRLPHWKTAAALLAIAVVGTLFGLPTLTEPFGVDQGIYGYIAERILDGDVDHRDIFDHKPPGIHFAYALAFTVFGTHMWSVWLLDLIAAILTGWGLYVLGRRLCGPRAGLVAGLLFVVYYEVVADWLSRAQPEIWLDLTFVWSIALIANSRNRVALIASGALFAIGLWFKPTLLPLAPIWLVVFVGSVLRDPEGGGKRIAIDLVAATVGGIVVFAIVLSYYARNGAIDELYEGLVTFNLQYHATGDRNLSLARGWTAVKNILIPVLPLTLMSLAAAAVPFFSRRRFPAILGWVWVVLAFATVFWQGSFQKAHYILVLAPLAFLPAVFLDYVVEAASRSERLSKSARRSMPAAVLLLLAVVVVGNVQGIGALGIPGIWGDRMPWSLAFKSGRITREKYYSAYQFPGRPYTFEDIRKMAAYLESETTQGDSVLVWGFRPLIAFLAHRKMPTRFCFRYPLTRANDPRWWNEFLMDLNRWPPAFIVVATADRGRYHPETSKDALRRNAALDQFVQAGYELDRTVPGFEIYKHR